MHPVNSRSENGVFLLECLLGVFLFLLLVSAPLAAVSAQSRLITALEARRRSGDERYLLRSAGSLLSAGESIRGVSCGERQCSLDDTAGAQWEREFSRWP